VSRGVTLQDLTCCRDGAGRILGAISSAVGESWTYGNDDLDRLTSATNTTDPSLYQSLAYDSVDNMTANSAVGTYTYSLPGSRGRWSGDHEEIKAAPALSLMTTPALNVWEQNPDGTWTNDGPARSFTGSGKPKGQRGTDREKSWKRL
jgi:hypothetical protein